MRKILILGLVFGLPLSAAAQNIGQCGWGSRLFDGEKGVIPQSLAATTNGTSGNQTFAITSGTSGCTQDGVVRSSWKTAMFIDSNGTRLAKDISSGDGEALHALASLWEMEEADKPVFFAEAKRNFSRIFPSENTSSEQIAAGLRSFMAENEQLAKYTELV